MRRAAVGAGVVALAAIAAGFARWPIAPGEVAARLNGALGETRPLTWRAPQTATFSALPWPNLRIIDARLDAASGDNIMTAPEARIDLSLIDLIVSRIAPARVTLVAPTITLDLDRPPIFRRFRALGALSAMGGFPSLGSVGLTNAVVRVTSRERGLDTVIENLRGRIDGLAPGARISADLSAVWRSAPLVVSGSLDNPRSAAAGKPSALTIAIASSLGDLTFDGALTAGTATGAAGTLSASSGALAEAIRLFGVKAPAALRGADLAISGDVKARPGDVTFDEATVTTSGQTLQGALRLAWLGGRLSVSGSLDAERLALAPVIGTPPPALAPDGSWSAKPLPIQPPRDFDFDLRLSASALDAYGVGLENVAASAILKDGALTANLLDATIYGGRLDGELRLARGDAGFEVAARAKLAGADLAAAAADFGRSDMIGKGRADFAVTTRGRSPAEMIADLAGKASVELTDGVLAGVNLEEALRRNQRRPLDVAKDMRSGGTAFERASVALLVGSGVAHVVNGALVARGVTAGLEGSADLADQSLNLRFNAAQAVPTGATAPNAARLGLLVAGPWTDPAVQVINDVDPPPPAPPTMAP
jgi:AsmA protein